MSEIKLPKSAVEKSPQGTHSIAASIARGVVITIRLDPEGVGPGSNATPSGSNLIRGRAPGAMPPAMEERPFRVFVSATERALSLTCP